MFNKNQSWLDKMAYYIENFKPHLANCIYDEYKKKKELSSLSRPLDDSVTLQELLQQLLSCGMSKEYLYNTVTNSVSSLNIDIT